MKRRRERGVTLVEIAVVVVIVSILAVGGLVAYRRHRAAARLSEATGMVAAIRAAQLEHFSETGVYAKVSLTLSSYYPATSPGAFATQWGGACTSCDKPDAWQRLKIQSPGPVMYGYSTVGGIGSEFTTTPDGITFTPTEPTFMAIGHGDTNADGIACDVVAHSHSNTLVITNESE